MAYMEMTITSSTYEWWWESGLSYHEAVIISAWSCAVRASEWEENGAREFRTCICESAIKKESNIQKLIHVINESRNAFVPVCPQ